MRATKKVVNYIREQVEAKIMPKYEAEKAEAERIISIRNNIILRAEEAAKQAARQAALAVFNELNNYTDILEYDEDEMAIVVFDHSVAIKNYSCPDSVYNWSHRMDKEVNKIVDDILVTLELGGGTKEDLDRMLSEL